MRDCARRAVEVPARMRLKHFVKNCVPLQHRQAARFWAARKRLVERGDVAVAEHQLAGGGVVGGMFRRSRLSESPAPMAGASETPARPGAVKHHARRRSSAALRRPCCARMENHCDRTANRRRPRRRVARTTGSPRARWRAPADDRAPGCRRSCLCLRPRSNSLRSSVSKLLTPQLRILPAATSSSNAATVSSKRIGSAPVQQVAIEPVGLQPRQRPLAGGDGAAPRRVARQHLRNQEHLVARRPAIASATTGSASPYISAVSMWLMPRSRPRRSAATARLRSPRSIYQVPCPITDTSGPLLPNFLVCKIASFAGEVAGGDLRRT